MVYEKFYELTSLKDCLNKASPAMRHKGNN